MSINNIDDLIDAMERVYETAQAFPEIGTSHEVIAVTTDIDAGLDYTFVVGKYFQDVEQISTETNIVNGVMSISLLYTLTAEEYEDAMDALEDVLNEEEFEGLDPEDLMDQNLLDITRDILRDLKERGDDK